MVGPKCQDRVIRRKRIVINSRSDIPTRISLSVRPIRAIPAFLNHTFIITSVSKLVVAIITLMELKVQPISADFETDVMLEPVSTVTGPACFDLTG